jgi:iron(III) transport system ATP-binding protein
MSSVVVSGLAKRFGGHTVLDGLDLTVPEGSLTAVLGPSGSGKTTLLRILAGFERADAGSVSIGVEEVDGGDGRHFVAPTRRKIGYVSQDGSLFPHLTVSKNIGFGLRRGPTRTRRVGELIELVSLTGMEDRFPHQLSGGQQQRVALARALAVEPPLVLLDEPFTSLDAELRSSVRGDVKRILKETGTTALLVTHDQDEALSWADFVAVIADGRIVQRSGPRDIYSRPAHIGMAGFVGVANLIDGTADGSSVTTAYGSLALLPGTTDFPPSTSVTVLVRPEQFLVSTDGGVGVPGHVTEVQFYGHDIVVSVALDRAPGTDVVIARAAGAFDSDVGSAVSLSVIGPVHAWTKAPTGS